MGDNNNNENVGGEDTDMQAQPSYPYFSNYFMTDKVYLYVFCVFLLNNFLSFRFFKSMMIC